MGRSRPWGSFLAWDGVLPLLVCLCPFATRFWLPKSDFTQLVVISVVPIIAAMVRCIIGVEHIRAACGGALPSLRQTYLSAAIVLLLLFEASVAVLAFAADAPLYLWWLPAGFYVCYLAFAKAAFAPRSKSRDLNRDDEPGKFAES